METIELLQKELVKINIELSKDKLDKLESYVEMLAKWNKAYNLVGNSTLDKIYTRHVLDSLQLVPFMSSGKKVLDFGAGAGIPSAILAIVREDIEFTACERIGKKCQFLNQVRRELGLDNFKVIQDDIRTIKDDFDIITCRAVATIEEILNLTAEIRQKEQFYLLLKGRQYKDELNQLKELDICFKETVHPSVVESDSVILELIVYKLP
ncbi:MAG: 16S rRNA (guanine(527)-N(7))-methyltransferase RsmG [Proteobacteria bacterium]|nr:16S rRNA (guanine(527)-N(7))-methyltransferase RsmG [Pseudomonadota bacterium]